MNDAFHDTAFVREPDGRLTTGVYRKPTHTEKYLAFDSYHLESVKCGIMCLFERAKRLVAKPSVISHEKEHLLSVLVCNGYPSSFVQSVTKADRQHCDQIHCSPSLYQGPLRTTSPLSTITRHTCYFKSDITPITPEGCR